MAKTREAGDVTLDFRNMDFSTMTEKGLPDPKDQPKPLKLAELVTDEPQEEVEQPDPDNDDVGMTVKDLMTELKNYNPNAKVVIADFSRGETYEPTIGSDDEDEGEAFCRIGIDN